MNYRHHYHAGNFADVVKHTLLCRLLRALQKKEKGFLYLDTHAGRGRYDLEVAARGDTHARAPEWPAGIGRLWTLPPGELPAAVADYVQLVREHDRFEGNATDAPRFYPGSPWFARQLARPVDRLALVERQPAECAALRTEFGSGARTSVQESDGYTALRAMLPPPERRALVLIDPPFEAQDEFAQIADGLREGLRRFPEGVYAVWYPLTLRARVDAFLDAVRTLCDRPALALELAVAGPASEMKLKGCGLLVLNPPWQLDTEVRATLEFLARVLAQSPGGGAHIEWIVRERPRAESASGR